MTNTHPQTPRHPVEAVKAVAGSPLALVTLILFSARPVFRLVESVVTKGPFGHGSPLGMALSSLLGSVPSILVLVGMWCLWAQARRPDNQPLKPRAFTLLKVGCAITLALLCAAVPVAAILCLTGGLPIFQYTVSTFLLFAGAVILLVGGLAILFHIQALRLIQAARRAGVQGDAVPLLPSAFMEVCCYLLAGLLALSAIQGIGAMNLLTLFSESVDAVFWFLCGWLLCHLRRALIS